MHRFWTPARRTRIPLLLALLALPGCGEPQAEAEAGGTERAAELAREAAAEAEARARQEAMATTGLDSALVAEARERARELPRLYSLIVARRGEILVEDYMNGAARNRIANIKSASKSVISSLVGIAVDDGLLEPDQPIVEIMPEWASLNDDPRFDEITVEHLLAMQSGLQSTSSNYGGWAASSNWVRWQVSRPFVDEPGGRMVYGTGNTHLLSAILTRVTGRSTLQYARDVLFDPMEVPLGPWTRDPQGIYLGGNEMGLRTRDLFTYGELYRNGGIHDGERLIPEDWIRESWVQRGTSRYNGHGYGLGWWTRERRGWDVRFAWGYGGQYVFIVPDLELTVVTTSNPFGSRAGGHTRAIHDLVTEVLIPAAERGDSAGE